MISPRTSPELLHLRPTVVRRRVVEIAPSPLPTAHFDGHGEVEMRNDEDEAPPSSIDVSRALRSLRGSDLERLEAIMQADDDV